MFELGSDSPPLSSVKDGQVTVDGSLSSFNTAVGLNLARSPPLEVFHRKLEEPPVYS
jgi:hypothetical protein